MKNYWDQEIQDRGQGIEFRTKTSRNLFEIYWYIVAGQRIIFLELVRDSLEGVRLAKLYSHAKVYVFLWWSSASEAAVTY